jgi:hypothetical protein
MLYCKLLFDFPLEYAIRKVQGNQVGLKLNGTDQLLVYVDYVNLLADSTDTNILKDWGSEIWDESHRIGANG